jgi:hypothetical protein
VGSLERLIDNRKKITPFVGTGATIAVLPGNPLARWDGLLEDGIRRCAELGQSREWAESTAARLRSGDLITHLGVADEVCRRLVESREWSDWIKGTVGSIKIDGGTAMHRAICSLNRIVLTTNYDLLLENASAEHESLHWKQYDKTREVINVNSRRAIIHLHGVATNTDSVVLGSWQYQALKEDITAQFWQDVLLSRGLLFIGCGAGVNDPNIGPVLEYVQFILNQPFRRAGWQGNLTELHENYILVRGCELREAREKFGGSNISPVAFGAEYTDLRQFLIDLAAGHELKASQDANEYDTALRAAAAQVRATPEGPPVSGPDAVTRQMDTSADAARSLAAASLIILGKEEAADFDVFLCHNGEDKPAVRSIAQQLRRQGILPWLDEDELIPGRPWQEELERQIGNIRAAAVFVGPSGIGPWQNREMRAFLNEFSERQCPVIPVLLPEATAPKLPLFLRGMTWVDLRISEAAGVERLIWGITGRRPEPLRLNEPQ